MNIFSTLQTEEDAYWFGYIMADGYNHKSGRVMQFTQAEQDKDMVYRLQKYIGKGNICVTNFNDDIKQSLYMLSVCSKELCSNLTNLGCVNNKSLIMRMPSIPDELFWHFLRGYFDGDGCFYKVKMGKKSGKVSDQFRISFAGNFNFLNNVGNIISSVLNISNKSINFNGSINVLTYGGNNLTLKVGAFLYKDALSFLERKYNLWKEFNDYYNSRKFVRS